MAEILPFKAIRPARDKATFVISKSYEDYSSEERRLVMQHNPFSFLHILNPGFKFDTQYKGSKRYSLVRNRYEEFLEEKILIQDEIPSLYLYRRSFENRQYCGIFCATSTHDYRSGLIKKHEDTLRRREELFADYLEQVGFNAEPVLMTYPDQPEIDTVLNEVMQGLAEYHFTSPDMVTHELWVINSPDHITRLTRVFGDIDALYIADGHHRSASSDLLAKRKSNGKQQNATYHYFMSYLIPESQVQIRGFNRLLTEMNGLSTKELLIRLDTFYRIHEKGSLPFRPEEKHTFSMYLEGVFYALSLRKKPYELSDAKACLDSQILYETILKPIFGIEDLRHDDRIHYRCGPQNEIEMKMLIDQGKYKVGFGMVPVTIEEIRAIADAGQTMPPKSTFIQPKLPSGLAIYAF
ncbi:DUF1015 domain-containing protein [Robiginitalea sp. IMCC43444]|uniref:DUF1015 domain-containing protein n=1 Tax=Robiginitalea sp. IMCC43444 TaxID=3459121 RepID=UPI0040432FEE